MHREPHRTMDIFCYAVFLLILTARCNADEGNRKGGNDKFSLTAFVNAHRRSFLFANKSLHFLLIIFKF